MNTPSPRRVVSAASPTCSACGHAPSDHDARFCPACGAAMGGADVIPLHGLVQLAPSSKRAGLARAVPTLLGVPRAQPSQPTAEVPRVGLQVARTRRSERIARPALPTPERDDAPPQTAPREPDLDLSRVRARSVARDASDEVLDDDALLAASGLGRGRRGAIIAAVVSAAIALTVVLVAL